MPSPIYLDTLIALNALTEGRGTPTALPPVTAPARTLPLFTPPPPPSTMQPPVGLAFPLPEAPPAAPMPALNQATIERFLSLAGEAPVRPVIQPASGLERVAGVLGGISAGLRGQGAEYAAGLREQRERPIREYEQRRERFESRRSELGVTGTRAAMEEAEQGRTRAQNVADRNFELEVQERSRQLNLRDQREVEMLRDTLLARRQREEDERRAAREQVEKDALQRRDARLFARDYRKAGAKDTIARELGEYDAGLRDSLSPAAAKWESAQNRLTEIRARRAASQGSGAGANAKAQAALAEFEAAKQDVIDAVARGDFAGEQQLRQVMNAKFRALGSRFPGVFELGNDGSGLWPYAKARGGQGQPQPAAQRQGGQTATPADLQQYATENGISIDEARQDFKQAGIQIVVR